MPIYGMPTVAQITTGLDALATVFKNAYAAMGVNASSETTTYAARMDAARKTILGDGATAYGLGNPALEQALRNPMLQAVLALRYDATFRSLARGVMDAFNGQVQQNLPSGWRFFTSAMNQPLDAHLLRLNAAHDGVPTTPSAAGTLTAVNDAAGTLPVAASGSATYLRHTLVGANDWDESLPSAEATRVAITTGKNAYSYQIASTVPTGVTKIRIYRGYFAGASGTNYYLKEVSDGVTAGDSYPAILITEPDAALRPDIEKPSWGQVFLLPEEAILMALAYSSSRQGDLAANLPLVLASLGMFSPANIALNPANGYLGLGNPEQSGLFGVSTITGASAQTWEQAYFQSENDAAAGLQGFAGAIGTGTGGLRVRVTTATNGTVVLTYDYEYFDATDGWGTTKTVTGATVTLTGAQALGYTQDIGITAGRIIREVTVTAKSGAGTSGAVAFEATALRSV